MERAREIREPHNAPSDLLAVPIPTSNELPEKGFSENRALNESMITMSSMEEEEE